MDHLSPASLPAITTAARLASALADGFGGRGAVTEAELLAQGYSQAELSAHLPEARRLSRSRFVKNLSPDQSSRRPQGDRSRLYAAARGASEDDPRHPDVYRMAELILDRWRAGEAIDSELKLHHAFCGSGFHAGNLIDHYFAALQLAIRWRDTRDGNWKSRLRYRDAVARSVVHLRPLRQSIDRGCLA